MLHSYVHQGLGGVVIKEFTAMKEQDHRKGKQWVHSHGRAELLVGQRGKGKGRGSQPRESRVTGDASEWRSHRRVVLQV